MGIFYSAKEAGFFDDRIHSLPDDAKEISTETHSMLLAGQAAGKDITANKKGLPVLTDPAPPTAEQLRDNALSERDYLLERAAIRIAPLQDAMDLDDATENDSAQLKAWKQYRVSLNRIQDQSGFPANFDWPVAPE